MTLLSAQERNGQTFSVRLDATDLTPGAHFATIDAIDTSDPGRGSIFSIPITVIVPHSKFTNEEAPDLKLNDEELIVFQEMFDLSGNEVEILSTLQRMFDLEIICITKGADGCSVFFDNHKYDVPGRAVKVADTVGSGDAFSAAFLVKLLKGSDPKEAAEFANKIGALVASKPGGTPEISEKEI